MLSEIGADRELKFRTLQISWKISTASEFLFTLLVHFFIDPTSFATALPCRSRMILEDAP